MWYDGAMNDTEWADFMETIQQNSFALEVAFNPQNYDVPGRNIMTTENIPFGLPSLSKGSHPAGSGEACIMEYVSVLSGENFTDAPACTHPVLAHLSRRTFDMMSSNEARYTMVPYIGRLFGTTPPQDAAERKQLAAALAKSGVEWAQKSAADPKRDEQTPDQRLLSLFVTVLDAYDAHTGRQPEQFYKLTNDDLKKFEAAGLAVTGSIS